MKRTILMVLLFFSVSSWADIGGVLFVNPQNSEAKMLVTETHEEGVLSRFYDQMQIDETVNGSSKLKQIQLQNGRFQLSCRKAVFSETPPSTSCTWVIRHGQNDADINTWISRVADEKVASIAVTNKYSRELNGIFPLNSRQSADFELHLPEGLLIEVKGSPTGHLTIGLSDR